MADIKHKLTIADQVFVNGMAYLTATVSLDVDRLELALTVLRRVMPDISRDHAFIGPLAEQADRLLGLPPGLSVKDRGVTYSSARFLAAKTLADFHFWRMGQADAALKDRAGGQ